MLLESELGLVVINIYCKFQGKHYFFLSTIDILRKKGKWNHVLGWHQKGREGKNGNKEGWPILMENSNKYNR